MIGTALRILGEDLAQVKARKPKQSLDEGLLDLTTEFLNEVAAVLPTMDQDFRKACAAYFKFERGVSLHQQTSEEREAYSAAPSLNGAARKVMGAFINTNRSLISAPRSQFAEGVLNEFSRLCRVHEFDTKDLCFYTGVKSFQLLNEYYRFLLHPIRDEVESPNRDSIRAEQATVEKGLLAFVEALDKSAQGEEWDTTRDFVAPTIRRWRELFVIYMQPQVTQLVPAFVAPGALEPQKSAPEKAKRRGG